MEGEEQASSQHELAQPACPVLGSVSAARAPPTLLAHSPASEQSRDPETEETFYLLLLWRPLELLSEQLSFKS